jgi:hypothetical protein
MLSTLLAVVLVGLSLALLSYLLRLLYNAVRFPLDGFLERQRFARAVSRAKRGDELLRAGDVEAALRELRASFYLHPIRNRSLAGTIANHHTGLLSRFISLSADAHGGPVRLLSLAKADRLLEERARLQRKYFVVCQGGPRMRRRQMEAELRGNRRELQATLHSLVTEVRTAQQPLRSH